MVRGKMREKKVAIYQAALRRVNRVGYGGLTMQELAKDAKLATGTVYLYFENKEDLVNEIIMDTKSEMMETIYKDTEENEPLYPYFKKIVSNYLDYGTTHTDKIIFLEQFYRSEFLTNETRSSLKEIWMPFFQYLCAPRNEMLLKDSNKEIMLSGFEGAIRQIIMKINSSNLPYTKLLRDQIVDMLWSSIRR